MIIDCGSCVMRDIACSDCVVTSLLDSSFEASPAAAGAPERLTEVSEETIEAISLLSSRGIVLPMRFSRANHG